MDTGHAITINGVQLWELNGSGTLSSNSGKMTGTRRFMCEWDDRPAALAALLGYSRWVGDVLVVVPPDVFPGFTFLKAMDLDSEGVGKPDKDTDDSALYDYARLTVVYRLPDSPVDGEEQEGQDSWDVTEVQTWRGEYLTVPEGGVEWGEGVNVGKPVLDKQIIPIGLTERRFMRKNLESIPKASIIAAQNHVNSGAFRGVAEGKLMFVGAESSKKANALGEILYDITYVFLERSVAWNKAWSADDEDWMGFITNGVDAALVFPLYNFGLLEVGTA